MSGTKRIFAFSAAIAAASLLFARPQQKVVIEPKPSYREGAGSNRRNPDLDTDVSPYINQWRNSISREGHGGLSEREMAEIYQLT